MTGEIEGDMGGSEGGDDTAEPSLEPDRAQPNRTLNLAFFVQCERTPRLIQQA